MCRQRGRYRPRGARRHRARARRRGSARPDATAAGPGTTTRRASVPSCPGRRWPTGSQDRQLPGRPDRPRAPATGRRVAAAALADRRRAPGLLSAGVEVVDGSAPRTVVFAAADRVGVAADAVSVRALAAHRFALPMPAAPAAAGLQPGGTGVRRPLRAGVPPRGAGDADGLAAGDRVLVDAAAHPDPRVWLVGPLAAGASRARGHLAGRSSPTGRRPSRSPRRGCSPVPRQLLDAASDSGFASAALRRGRLAGVPVRIFLTGTSSFLPLSVRGTARTPTIVSGMCRGDSDVRSSRAIFARSRRSTLAAGRPARRTAAARRRRPLRPRGG